MGSKKRIYYTAPQKKIKQKWKNRYEIAKNTPKKFKYRKTLEYAQKYFLKKHLTKRKFTPLKNTFNFYNKITSPIKKFVKKFKSKLHLYQIAKRYKKIIEELQPVKNFKLTKKGAIRLYQEDRLIRLLAYSFYSLNSFYTLTMEAKTLFQLSNTTQQYHLATIGINYPYFQTTSSGKELYSYFGKNVSKSLKKSLKLNKLFVEYYYNKATFNYTIAKYTHTFIKPFNKKALILFNQIQENAAYYPTIIGFRKYYKTNFKTSRRIKKKIKKKIISENFRFQPYKTNS